jgi:putative phosphoribosyl transferase
VTLRPAPLRTTLFADRADAGRRLAPLLDGLGPSRPVVLGMARGGVPVAHELASLLAAPLDVLLVRKLGHPSQPELGLGALAEDAVRVLNEPLLARLSVPPEVIEDLTRRETGELLRRLSLYRSGRPPLDVRGRPVVVVDDGLATGFTARAALELVRRRGAAPVILAVPVGSPEAVASLRPIADEVLCLEVSDRFSGISQCYRDFTQVTDDEVTRLLGSPTA